MNNGIYPPSNMYPPKNYTNPSPFGMFKGMSTNVQSNSSLGMSNYAESYMMSQPLIEKTDFKNKREVLHDNLADNLQNEHIIEHRVHIDSRDRDINAYPDPFKFVVSFAPASRQTLKSEVWVDPSNKSLGRTIKYTTIDGPPAPHINKAYQNVKYVRLENIVLPKSNKINKAAGPVYTIDTTTFIGDDRFIIMVIKELNSDNTVATNSLVESGFLLFPDRQSTSFFTALPYYSTKNFNDSLLGNINKMSFEFFTSFGEPINMGIYGPGNVKLNESLDIDPANVGDVNHALNNNIQNHITFILGIVENQLNTNPKYE